MSVGNSCPCGSRDYRSCCESYRYGSVPNPKRKSTPEGIRPEDTSKIYNRPKALVPAPSVMDVLNKIRSIDIGRQLAATKLSLFKMFEKGIHNDEIRELITHELLNPTTFSREKVFYLSVEKSFPSHSRGDHAAIFAAWWFAAWELGDTEEAKAAIERLWSAIFRRTLEYGDPETQHALQREMISVVENSVLARDSVDILASPASRVFLLKKADSSESRKTLISQCSIDFLVKEAKREFIKNLEKGAFVRLSEYRAPTSVEVHNTTWYSGSGLFKTYLRFRIEYPALMGFEMESPLWFAVITPNGVEITTTPTPLYASNEELNSHNMFNLRLSV